MTDQDRYRYDAELRRWLLAETSGSVEWHRFNAEYLISFDILLNAAVFIWVREDSETRHEAARGLLERRSYGDRVSIGITYAMVPRGMPPSLVDRLQIFTRERFDAMVEEINRIAARGKS